MANPFHDAGRRARHLDSHALLSRSRSRARFDKERALVRPRHLRQEFRDHDPPSRRTAHSYQLTGDQRLLALAEDLGTPTAPRVRFTHRSPLRLCESPAPARSAIQDQPRRDRHAPARVRHPQQTHRQARVFDDKAKRALVETFKRRSPLGLVGSSINVETGAWWIPTATSAAASIPIMNTSGNAGACSATTIACDMWNASIPAVQ